LAAAVLQDAASAANLLGVRISPEWVAARRDFVAFRLSQMQVDAAYERWLLWAVATRRDGVAIGHVGFHGPPGVNALRDVAALEIGYAVDEPYRGHRYASEAVGALMDWAVANGGPVRFLASISPANAPSLAVARRLGFREVTRVWDELDGEEIVHELTRPSAPPQRRGGPASSTRLGA
jgi:ribosomal-protein-alanine N-acetyltransferase